MPVPHVNMEEESVISNQDDPRLWFHNRDFGRIVLTYLDHLDALNLSIAVCLRNRIKDVDRVEFSTLVHTWSKGKALAMFDHAYPDLKFSLSESHRHWYSRSYAAYCWQRIVLCDSDAVRTYNSIHSVLLTFFWRNQGWPYHESIIYVMEGNGDSRNITRKDFFTPAIQNRIVSQTSVRTKRNKNFVAGRLIVHNPLPNKVYELWFQIGGGIQLEIRNVALQYLVFQNEK